VKRITPGATVRVRMYDARIIEGQICMGGILKTTAGIEVRVRSAYALYTVNADQIVKVLRRRSQEAR
jgi:hypothetical protein